MLCFVGYGDLFIFVLVPPVAFIAVAYAEVPLAGLCVFP